MTATNASNSYKALRGIKRVCQACQVRFYDLARERIVCPECGAVYTPAAQASVETRRSPVGSGKTVWRQVIKRPIVVPDPEAETAAPADDAAAETEAEVPAADAAPEDDSILEQEPGDFSDLLDGDIEGPKDR
jgi:uncharacterized protein (TIGR02300 family)